MDFNPYMAKNADMAILISSLLTDYFEANGVHSIMIPNIVDLSDKKWNVRKAKIDNDVLKIAYAGVPGVGKDELATVVKAILLLPDDKKSKTELHIYGSSADALKSYLCSQEVLEIPSFVVCHGRLMQEEIPARLNECHYTILIRKPSLRANAGFSTKMVESFAAGIPMIANITGDIGTYLKDGINGLIVDDESVQACSKALLAAWSYLDRNPIMREEALKTAANNFDYRQYCNEMSKFLDAII